MQFRRLKSFRLYISVFLQCATVIYFSCVTFLYVGIMHCQFSGGKAWASPGNFPRRHNFRPFFFRFLHRPGKFLCEAHVIAEDASREPIFLCTPPFRPLTPMGSLCGCRGVCANVNADIDVIGIEQHNT